MGFFGKLFSSDKNKRSKAEMFDVFLTECNMKAKIMTIKEIRILKQMGLAEAKDLVESTPVLIASGLSMNDASEIKLRLENAGAKAEVKPSK